MTLASVWMSNTGKALPMGGGAWGGGGAASPQNVCTVYGSNIWWTDVNTLP
jgi:hypothetical protein